MFDNSILNVVSGLVFIFLIYSLFATSLQEILASFFQSRANTLYEGIKSMLTNTDRDQSYFSRIGSYLKHLKTNLKELILPLFYDTEAITLYDKFYHHPIIKNYGENSIFRKPSYLTSANFATIFIDTIKNLDTTNEMKPVDFNMIATTLINYSDLPTSLAKAFPARAPANALPIPCETFKILNYYLNESGGDLDVFKGKLEQWYNDTMDRVSGWYKRGTQWRLFFIGLLLAISCNINTIKITGMLSKNDSLAGKLADMGAAVANNPAYKDTALAGKIMESVNKQKADINNLLGLGWTFKEGEGFFCKVGYILGQAFCSSSADFFGFIITAIAISLGAPFWFDLLNKFVNLRSAGKTVDTSGSSAQNNQANNIDG